MGFETGRSGNPGGRPRKSEQQIRFEQRCRDWSDLYAFNKLKDHAEHKDAKVFMWAISELLSRGFGKPTESVEAHVTGDIGAGVDEIRSGIAALVGRGQAGSGKADSPPPVES